MTRAATAVQFAIALQLGVPPRWSPRPEVAFQQGLDHGDLG